MLSIYNQLYTFQCLLPHFSSCSTPRYLYLKMYVSTRGTIAMRAYPKKYRPNHLHAVDFQVAAQRKETTRQEKWKSSISNAFDRRSNVTVYGNIIQFLNDRVRPFPLLLVHTYKRIVYWIIFCSQSGGGGGTITIQTTKASNTTTIVINNNNNNRNMVTTVIKINNSLQTYIIKAAGGPPKGSRQNRRRRRPFPVARARHQSADARGRVAATPEKLWKIRPCRKTSREIARTKRTGHAATTGTLRLTPKNNNNVYTPNDDNESHTHTHRTYYYYTYLFFIFTLFGYNIIRLNNNF